MTKPSPPLLPRPQQMTIGRSARGTPRMPAVISAAPASGGFHEHQAGQAVTLDGQDVDVTDCSRLRMSGLVMMIF